MGTASGPFGPSKERIMWKRASTQIALAGLLCFAPMALAQNADQNSAGPTRNQLQLRLTEPREGAQITGSSVRVAVDYTKTSFGEGQGTKFGDKNFPMRSEERRAG